jgi:NADH:ubiquinone oxidoreductase subunit 5 (subunit L)/multisubunit Na+/H+ antiporter MnhA subunit
MTTPALADVLRAYNPNVAVFANQVAELPPPPSPRAGPEVVLIFAAFNRATDWPPYVDALNRVLARRPRLRVMVIHDKAFFEAPAPGVDLDHYHEAPLSMVAPLCFTAAVSVFLGLYPETFIQFIRALKGFFKFSLTNPNFSKFLFT